MSAGPKPRPESGLELYAWIFMRVSGVVLLFMALIHGVNGTRTILVDYLRPRGWLVASLAALYVVGFAMLALGSLVILTFQPALS